ncbi:hypothetical protein V8G54_024822 [Vigna mungo]|uniref:Uncharacterized protein n=1 Tax=Vigna mungo TaxID=3915 RepID=A0AAQ3N7H4_VIGMU
MVFQSFLRNPRQPNARLYLAGGLKMEERLLHYLIVWLLCPRGSNHAQCSETDLIIMYGILQSIPLNWPHLFQTIMFKAKRYETVLPTHRIGENSLRQMGFLKQGDSFVHPDDVAGVQEEEEEGADNPLPDPTNVASSSQLNQEYSLESLSRQMTEMARLQHEMMNIQNTRHEEICTHLLNLDTRISGLEKHFISDDSAEF